jgi:hypothetical protein
MVQLTNPIITNKQYKKLLNNLCRALTSFLNPLNKLVFAPSDNTVQDINLSRLQIHKTNKLQLIH